MRPLPACASGYRCLNICTFALALGNGAVEAAINPILVTAHNRNITTSLTMVLGPVVIYTAVPLRQPLPLHERVSAGVPYRAMLAAAG